MSSVPMTPEGLQKIKDELKDIKAVQRPQNVRDIEEARAHGDLKENAEYHAAKEKQGHIQGRLELLEDYLARAEVIDPKKINEEKVVFGATVTLLDVETDEEVTYQIVGSMESDIKEGKISIEAPLAKLMIGKYAGDEIVFKNAKGSKEYEVVKIEYK